MKKVLLTGATGFIGRHVTKELLKRGYKVFAIINSSFLPEEKNLVQIKADIFDEENINKIFEMHKFKNFIHLAWYLGPQFSESEVNKRLVDASMKMFEAFKQNSGQKVLIAGSMSEYDFSQGYLNEDSILNNSSLYGKSKAELFKFTSEYAKNTGLDFKWARIFNVYGPYERKTRLMPSVICSILKDEEAKLSTCEKTQDYLHVVDVATAIVDFFESDVQGAVNICSATPVKLKDIVEKINELMGGHGKILYGAIASNFEEPFVVGYNKRLTDEIGWTQQISLEEGLKQTIKWWEENV